MRQPKCRCGHARSWHLPSPQGGYEPCLTNRCANICNDWRPVNPPRPGERPIFGVHTEPETTA